MEEINIDIKQFKSFLFRIKKVVNEMVFLHFDIFSGKFYIRIINRVLQHMWSGCEKDIITNIYHLLLFKYNSHHFCNTTQRDKCIFNSDCLGGKYVGLWNY